MVVTHAVAGVGNLEHESLHLREIRSAMPGRLASAHHAAAPEHPAVAPHDEFHAGGGVAIHVVIHAHAGGKTLAITLQNHPEKAFRVGAEAAQEFLTANGQGLIVDRYILVRIAIALRGDGKIQFIQPDGFGGGYG